MMSKPAQFKTRKIVLVSERERELFINAAKNAPLGIEGMLREPVKTRKLDQNALLWVGPIADMVKQAWVNGRTYTAEVWHHHLKQEFLPEDDDPDLERLVKDVETWKKWDYTPSGERILVGSTTQLSIYGFSQYLEQVYAFGASLGVRFSAGKQQ